jgi:hypothetical protein
LRQWHKAFDAGGGAGANGMGWLAEQGWGRPKDLAEERQRLT